MYILNVYFVYTIFIYIFCNKFSLGHHLQASTKLVHPPFTNTFTFHPWNKNNEVSLVDCALVTKVTAISLRYQLGNIGISFLLPP